MFDWFSKLEIKRRKHTMIALERIWNIKLIEIKLKCEINAYKNTGEDKFELWVAQNADLDSKPDGNKIVEIMQVMELQRIPEDSLLNEWNRITEVADLEVLPNQQENQNIRNEHLSAEQMQVIPESPSSVMQVEDNKEIQSCKVEPGNHISSLKLYILFELKFMLIRNVGEDKGKDMIGIYQILETFGLTRD